MNILVDLLFIPAPTCHLFFITAIFGCYAIIWLDFGIILYSKSIMLYLVTWFQ